MADHPAESCHWYDPKTGDPKYSYLNKKGEEKPTTLREARKEGFVPSVTTILQCAYRPGLENWKIDQAILAALTCPRIDDESETAYLSRIKSDAKAQARKAAERGTLIHAWVQQGFEGKYEPVRQTMIDLEDERLVFYDSARKTVNMECGLTEWICEKSFATNRYGGKVDLHCNDYLIDIKTTEKDLADIKTWDEHDMQAAAYDNGLGVHQGSPRKCGILYIHALTAEAKIVWIPEDKLQRGWLKFTHLLNYWYGDKGL
jgi:hypothetical protein